MSFKNKNMRRTLLGIVSGWNLLYLLVVAAPAQPRQTNVDLIIKGGTVVTMDGSRRVVNDAAIAVKNGRIAAIGNSADIDREYSSGNVLDARGKVIIPGLINGHTHVPMTLF